MHKHDNRPVTLEDGIKGYEKKDVIAGKLIMPFAILTAVTVVCAIIALLSWNAWKVQSGSSDVAVLPVMDTRTLPPLPRIQEAPAIDIQAYHEHEKQKLEHYAWVDKQAGIVQIPVARAMEIIAEKHLPFGREAHIPGKSQQPGAPATADHGAAAPAAAAPVAAPAPAAEPAATSAPAQGQ